MAARDTPAPSRLVSSRRAQCLELITSRSTDGFVCRESSEHVSSLRVEVPAWVEFLHRGRHQGQLAFIVSVRAVPRVTASNLAARGSSVSTSDSAVEIPEFTPALAVDDKAARSTAAAAADACEEDPANREGDGDGDGDVASFPESGVFDSVSSGSAAGPGPGGASTAAAWTCVRTGRDLSGVVQMYRESIAAHVKEGLWESRARPRVLRHMGTADQVERRA